MEHLINIFRSADPDMQVFALTTAAALIAWITKSFVEGPLAETKATFTRIVDQRMAILVSIKIKLQLIKVFRSQSESQKLKERLYQTLISDERCCFVNPDIIEEIIAISVHKENDEKLIGNTIKKIDSDLSGQIGKIRDEIVFYHRFSGPKPFKRVLGILRLTFEYLLTLFVLIAGFALVAKLVYLFFDANN